MRFAESLLAHINHSIVTVISLLTASCFMLGITAEHVYAANAEETPAKISFDGLVLVPDSNVATAYIAPDADFSVYKRVMILEPQVAFRKNWQKDQNRSRVRKITDKDIEKIKADVATLLKDVFTEKLEADNGYLVTDEPADDVLLLRPSIVDLDITAPDIMTSGRSATLVTTSSTGAATLYLELFDAPSGQILGRAIDQRSVRPGTGTVTWANRVTNTADGRRVFNRWASLLRDFLDEHYVSDQVED